MMTAVQFMILVGISNLHVYGTKVSPAYFIVGATGCKKYGFSLDFVSTTSVSLRNPWGGGLCTHSVFGITYAGDFVHRLNCSVDVDADTFEFCLSDVTVNDGGNYTIAVPGPGEFTFTLYALDRPTTPEIKPISVTEGSNVTLTCVSRSTSTPYGQTLTYTWAVNGSTSINKRYTVHSNKMTIELVQLDDRYNKMRCSVKEKNGLSSSREMFLHVDALNLNEVTITSLTAYPSDEVAEATNMTMSCMFTSSRITTVTWTKIANSKTVLLTKEMSHNESTLTVTSVTCLDFANYMCSVQNGDDTWTSRTRLLRIHCQPRIIACDKARTFLLEADVGLLNFTINVIAYPTPTICVRKTSTSFTQNATLDSSFAVKLQTEGPNSVFIISKNLTEDSDFGYYNISLANRYGTDGCLFRIQKLQGKLSTRPTTTDTNILPFLVPPIVLVIVVCIAVPVAIVVRRKHCNRSSSEYEAALEIQAGSDNPAASTYQDLDSNPISRLEQPGEHLRPADETSSSPYQNLNLTIMEGEEHQYTHFSTGTDQNREQSHFESQHMRRSEEQLNQYLPIVVENNYQNADLNAE